MRGAPPQVLVERSQHFDEKVAMLQSGLAQSEQERKEYVAKHSAASKALEEVTTKLTLSTAQAETLAETVARGGMLGCARQIEWDVPPWRVSPSQYTKQPAGRYTNHTSSHDPHFGMKARTRSWSTNSQSQRRRPSGCVASPASGLDLPSSQRTAWWW